MEKETRSAIERATQRARKLLEDDFAAQLEGDHDILRDGTVAPKPGPHLSPRDVFCRDKIVAAIEHKRAAGMTAPEAVVDYLRDAAFTALNRFVALKMLEERDLVQECVTKGEQSTGYKEFCGLASGLALLPDSAGYRLYIESLFDELSTEVKVLFDRRDPASVLWPRRQTFEDLLAVLNGAELASVWGEDETIGWVYQYFNSGEERRAMRDASQAPRNSRELAVRNQFFTPRYVVEFLTDNTLGRIWYEMRHGETSLRDRCQYMVRRPKEVFLRDVWSGDRPRWIEGVLAGRFDEIPEDLKWADAAALAHAVDGYSVSVALGLGECGDVANAAREEARRTGEWKGSAIELWLCLFFEARAERHSGCEPGPEERAQLDALCRTLRRRLVEQPPSEAEGATLVALRRTKDPRDLRILDPACGSGHFLLYAFELLIAIYEEAYTDPASPKSEATGKTLAEDYSTIDALRKAVPGLVLAHNLHGVDIDPRCAQIAGLALWMRAQRAYRDFGVGRAERPPIRRSNVVVAEPLVADDQLAKAFVARLGDAELGRVFTALVDALKLAGDLGLLLKVEKLVAHDVDRGTTGDLFAPPEEQIRAALARFVADEGDRSNMRRRLFADDALQGVGLLEICAQRFDAVLMNPPFGEMPDRVGDTIERNFPAAKHNAYIAFALRAVELLNACGLVGAIADATFIHQTRYEEFRSELLTDTFGVQLLVANGWGVLDAYVETACVVLTKGRSTELTTFDVRAQDEKAATLQCLVRRFCDGLNDENVRTLARQSFLNFPKKVLAFWLPPEILRLYKDRPSLAPLLADARCGMSSSDNPRFYKLRWEVPGHTIGAGQRWRFLANGGGACPLFRQQVYVVNWGADGREAKSRVADLYGSASRTIINESYYFRPGLTYGKRTESFTAQFLPAGQVFSNEGQAIFPHAEVMPLALLAYLNSTLVAYLLNSIAGQHKEAGYVGSIPAAPVEFLASERVVARMARAHEILLRCASGVPESQVFSWPLAAGAQPGERSIHSVCQWIREASRELEQIFLENDRDLEKRIGFGDDAERAWTARCWRLEAAVYECTPSEIEQTVAVDFVSFLLGVAFGRWTLVDNEAVSSFVGDPFCELSAFGPAEARRRAEMDDGVFVSDAGHPRDVLAAIDLALTSPVARGVDVNELAVAYRLLDSDVNDPRLVLSRRLFEAHLRRYSKSRRKAPIYWQLATPSASYSVWLYIHAFTTDTLFRVQQDYATPKLAHEERKLQSMRADFGPSPKAGDRKLLEAQETFVEELRAFLAELKLVTPLWAPHLDDGVVINAAPLWRLFPQHKPWQKELKSTWDSLCDGEYDWSHMAMHLWPERVVPKCVDDRSLAIAHGLEDELWIEGDNGKWKKREQPVTPIADLIKARTSAAVKEALKSLLEAPQQTGSSKGGGKRGPRAPKGAKG